MDEGEVLKNESLRWARVVWKARNGLIGSRGGLPYEVPEVGEVTDGEDAAITLDCPSAVTAPSNPSPSISPPAGVSCVRERTRSVPAPYVGRTASTPPWSVTSQTYPEEAMPSAVAETRDFTWSTEPRNCRMAVPKYGDSLCS